MSSHIWPAEDQIERAAEAYVAWCAQREIGHFPVRDDDRDMARFMLHHVNENTHGPTWNATPFICHDSGAEG